MAKYAIGNDLGGSQQAIAASYKTLVSMFATSGSARRGKMYDILIGTNGTPADNYLEWDVSRMTADGTGSVITPNALDPADAAALGTAKANYTVESGSITANSSLFYVGVNQRASYRWVAAPGSELVYPALANNGLVGRARSGSYTGTATFKALVEEQ
ncbi:MAG TPA: hypothetical protein VGX95_11275 [Xanthobacteraceae bacterium]|jgi:hypothetical protein|nr:hypothetical protein [Xanthobacteraceae bacterium]